MKKILALAFTAAILSSCSTTNKSMREPNARVEFQKEDFEFSGVVNATAKTVKVFGIDFSRLFDVTTGSTTRDGQSSGMSYNAASIPVIGTYVSDKTQSYALYELMENNKGYDVVFYPQFRIETRKPIGFGWVTITTVDVQARLAKIKE